MKGIAAFSAVMLFAAVTGALCETGPAPERQPSAEVEYLIWEPDILPGSGQAILDALVANGSSGLITLDILPFNLEEFQGLFVCLGIYPHNYIVPAWSPEAIKIEEYLDVGGRVYLECGDCWYWDPLIGGHEFGPSFGINGIDDGEADLFFLEGIAGTFTETLFFSYVGENEYMDHLETYNPPTHDDHRLFTNVEDGATHGVAYLNRLDGSRTLGVSFEFGGLESNLDRAPFDSDELMARYLNWFHPPDTAYLRMVEVSTDTSEYMPGDSLYLDVKWEYVNTINSLQWTFTVIGAVAKDSTGYKPRMVDTHAMENTGPGLYSRHIGMKVPNAAPLNTPGISFGRVVPASPFETYKVDMFGNPFWVGEATVFWEYYDDGTYENSIAASDTGFAVAARITPMHYPATIESIGCWIDYYDNMYNSADMYIYSDAAGLPDTVLAGPYTIQASSPPERIVVGTNVSMTSGDFHVVLTWTDANGYGPFVSADQDTPAATGRHFWKGQSGWVQLSTLGSPFDELDLSLRAFLSFSDSGTAAIETEPGRE